MTMWAADARLRRNTWIWKGLGREETQKCLVFVFCSAYPRIRVKWGQILLRKTRTKQPHWVMTSVLSQEVGEPFVISSCKVPERGAITSIGYTQLQHLQAFGTRGLSPPKNHTCESVLSLVGRRPWNLIRYSWCSKGLFAQKIKSILPTKP